MAVKYCPKCGYANAVDRGACLMCHTPLPAVAVEEGQQPVPVVDTPIGLEAMAAVLIEATEGSLAGMEGGVLGAERDVDVPEEYNMAALEEMAAEPTPAHHAEPIGETAPAEPAEEAAEEPEEEYIPPPPPPGVVELEEETAESVAAVSEQYATEQEIFEAPPAPPAPEEETEESAGGEWTIGED